MKKLLVMMVLAAVAGSASAADYTFIGGPAGLDAYENLAYWEVGGAPATVLPGINDDVTTATDARFTINDGGSYFLNSLTGNDSSGSFVQSGKLTITSNAVLNTGLSLSGAGDFEWGAGTGVTDGLMTIGDGVGLDTFSMTFGDHDGTRVNGDDLTLSASGQLRYNWWTAGTKGSTTADIGLSGDLTFTAGSSVKVELNGGAVGALDEGAYYLVRSDNITGDVPTLLTNANWDEDQAANSYLSFVETGANQGLYLNVIPEPATLGLIAFVGAGMVWIRRTFMI